VTALNTSITMQKKVHHWRIGGGGEIFANYHNYNSLICLNPEKTAIEYGLVNKICCISHFSPVAMQVYCALLILTSD